MLNKIGSAEVNATLLKAASALRGQQSEIDRLRVELSVRDRRGHAEKIANSAVERGIMAEEEAKDYADSLIEGDKDLDIVEEFVSRTAAGIPLSSSLQKTASATGTDEETDVLTSFLLTNDIP